MWYSPLDIHKMSGVLFVEAKGRRDEFQPSSNKAGSAEVTVSASSQSLDAAFLLRSLGSGQGRTRVAPPRFARR
jgi:hypothetical protein